MLSCRLLIDAPAPGIWNMAVDEALLEHAASGGWTLRFYAWNEPTLSLGYFQAHSDRLTHAASRGLPLVRRASGGGAIVHDHELTYSLSGPAPSASSSATQGRLCAVHAAWVEVLTGLGVEAHLCQAARSTPHAVDPFLCFQRRGAGDVLAGGIKLAGSAQRRRRGAVLQHGSVLLARSDAAPELPGLASLIGACPSMREWIERAIGALSRSLRFQFDRGQITLPELARATTLAANPYGLTAWNERR
ncbi:MAG TPA: biotin/lipoate A/B protein ligase family protein [Pirellulales bacterium]|nr:biotin/lipoate A/B protein ligase family protein [Pirellulales bacterium]